MKLLLICIYYSPNKTSAAVQMSDLAKEIYSRKINVDVLTTDSTLKKDIEIEIDFEDIKKFLTSFEGIVKQINREKLN